jgi:Ca-activated chloride channel homolog
MEFLNPSALLGLLALPILLLAYLVRSKPRRMTFSSLLLLADTGDRPTSRSWGALQLPWIFFLQLLMLALLVIALSEPVFSVSPTYIAIVLDNSASMQALEDGKRRFALAQEKARSLIDEVGLNGRIDIYTTAPRLEKLGADPLSPVEAAKVLAGLEAYDIGEPPVDYDQALHQLANTGKFERVFLLTDRSARGHSGVVRVITIGQPKANLALTGFEVRRTSLNSTRFEAFVEVANFSAKDEKIRIAIKNSVNQVVARRELLIGAGKRASANIDVIAEYPFYQAEIEPNDALPVDNLRFAVAPSSRSLRILGVSPKPKELASLKAIPGVQIDVIAPDEYGRTDRTGYGLEIFHFSAPVALPRTPALFILPPQDSLLVDLDSPASNVAVTNWREPHVLTRYINFSLFRLPYARALRPQTIGEKILEGVNGSLAFTVERQGLRYLTLGFDPFPYLGRENLPMSIFTLNFLDWFLAGAFGNQATGEPIALSNISPGDLIITPKGDKLPLKPGHDYFSGTVFQGIYQRYRGDQREISAHNLEDDSESDLRAAAPIEIRGNAASATGMSVLFSFWPYIVMISLTLLLVEWFSTPRPASWGFALKHLTLRSDS